MQRTFSLSHFKNNKMTNNFFLLLKIAYYGDI